MKKMRLILAALITAAVLLCGCSPAAMDEGYNLSFSLADGTDNYQFEEIRENGFVDTSVSTQSIFSLDRNTASYALARRQISDGLKINKGSVRLEEYVNYFDYGYPAPQNGDALSVSGKLFDCPWNAENKLFTVGVAAEEVEFADRKPNNLVFLIDVSGSMYGSDRLGLIQQAFTMLTENLADEDTVSIVTYAGSVRIAMEGARGREKVRIANVLQDLDASGSTAGAGGIQLAYNVAEKYFIEGGNNRVLLATDGDFNVGISDKNSLKQFIAEKRDGKNIYLSVMGVGMYNTSDTTLKTLAENGNGNYAYLDSITEARKVLVKEMGGTLVTVAKDAKISVDFNPDTVGKFRLIGYETKMMTEEEFEDTDKDAGEIGSGHTVTAVYELNLKENAEGNIASACLRYKDPETSEQKEINTDFGVDLYKAVPDEDAVFIGCVTEFGLVLRESEYKGTASLSSVIMRLRALDCVTSADCDEFKAEFLEIVLKASEIYG